MPLESLVGAAEQHHVTRRCTGRMLLHHALTTTGGRQRASAASAPDRNCAGAAGAQPSTIDHLRPGVVRGQAILQQRCPQLGAKRRMHLSPSKGDTDSARRFSFNTSERCMPLWRLAWACSGRTSGAPSKILAPTQASHAAHGSTNATVAVDPGACAASCTAEPLQAANCSDSRQQLEAGWQR